MANINFTAYVGTDSRVKVAILATDKDIVSGAVETTTGYVNFSNYTIYELVFQDKSASPGADITVDSSTNPEVFIVEDDFELVMKFGLCGLTAGKTYQARLLVYDAGDADEGYVLADYSSDVSTDTIIIKAV